MNSASIGSLRHRLTVERAQKVDDGSGGVDVTWVSVAQVWAELHASSGRERVENQRVSGDVTHMIIVRYRTDILPEMRFRRANRVWEILASYDPDGRGRRLHCMCEERDL